MRDNWAVGYAGRYTVGVWVGNFSGAPMHDVSGVDGAAPVWREVMDFLQEGATPRAPRRARRRRAPARHVCGRARARARRVVHRRHRARDDRRARRALGRARTSRRRRNGAIYAIDPDIPATASGWGHRARRAARTRASCSKTAGRRAPTGRSCGCRSPGRREVVLKGADGKELDRVSFEVRGLRRAPRSAP